MTAGGAAAPGAAAGRTDGLPADGHEVYATEVVAVGALVGEFVASGVLVLFGEQAPEELHEFSVLHRPSVQEQGPRAGDVVVVGDTALPVLAVGDVVAANLLQLGHLDLKADGRDEPAMPGDVCVPVGRLPDVAVGQSIRIVRSPQSAGPGEGGTP